MKRREFLQTSIAASAAILTTTTLSAGETHQPVDNRKVSDMAFPEKRPLITYLDRPPLLESPRSTFARGITENDEFFVRWHLPDIPTHIDTDSCTIKIDGLVEKELEIFLKELKNDFEQVGSDSCTAMWWKLSFSVYTDSWWYSVGKRCNGMCKMERCQTE